jgi:hypothetical protein
MAVCIYLTQDSGQNFTSLLKITENIVVVCQKDYPLFGEASEHVKKIKSTLEHFDASVDLIVPSGDPINIGVVFHELLKKGGGKISCLKWDRQSGVYVPVKVNIDENNNINENQ